MVQLDRFGIDKTYQFIYIYIKTNREKMVLHLIVAVPSLIVALLRDTIM